MEIVIDEFIINALVYKLMINCKIRIYNYLEIKSVVNRNLLWILKNKLNQTDSYFLIDLGRYIIHLHLHVVIWNTHEVNRET